MGKPFELINEVADMFISQNEQQKLFDEIFEAFKETHKLYVESLKRNSSHFTHDITRISGNERIFNLVKSKNDEKGTIKTSIRGVE